MAAQNGLPLREHSPVRYFSSFYGQWGGQTHLEQISLQSLVQMLQSQIQDPITELSCHPGYVAATEPSGYATERVTELRTLCDPTLPEVLAQQSIQLISYRDLSRLSLGVPA